MALNNYRNFLLLLACACIGLTLSAEDAYRMVAQGRAEKIVNGMGLPKEDENYALVVNAITDQYVALNALHEARETALKGMQESLGGSSEETLKAAGEVIEEGINKEVTNLHIAYCARLASLLPAEQVNAVKDGMTYNVANNTYKVYMDMFPNLDAGHRNQIKAWLFEAREHAMDGGSSDEKHWWFGKYKGRINNYLSKLGYDLKKAEQDMWARKKAEK